MANLSEKTLYEIFSLAIEGERQAQEIYSQGARLAGEETDLGKMFLRLTADEAGHEKQLLADYAEFKRRLKEQGLA